MFKSKTFSLIVSIFLLISLPVGIYLLQQQTHFLNKAFGTPANIFIDVARPVTGPQTVWKNLAQGGEEKGRMLASVIPQISSLHPMYIRIDHIYDLYNVVSKDSAGSINFNWADLDAMVSDIRAMGATPFFSLSYMPPSISSNGQITSMPANWSDWELVVQRTIEHFSGRNGMNLSGVYYEVWNEPDLFGDMKVGQYMDLYSHSAAGASRASNVNGFKFGGPASTDLYQNWFDSMFKLAGQGVRMDFFSWHKYSKDIQDYTDEIANAKKWIANYPFKVNTELIISEIGIDSKNDPSNDGNLAAIQLLATAADLEGNINRMFTFEVKDGPGDKQYWGRWGLFTNDKFGAPQAKPRYSALAFLNQMRGTKLFSIGEGSWVRALATLDGNVIRVLVVDYDPYGNHAESVPIRVDHIKNQNYTVKRIEYGGGIRTRTTTITGGVLDLTEGFTANTAAIFEITPQ